MVVWTSALRHPERVAGVVGMNVPFVPRPPAPTVPLLRQLVQGVFFHMVSFQQPGVADAEVHAARLGIMADLDVTGVA
jgi:hypothetical protein